MLLIPSKQQEKMQNLMQQIAYGFNSGKIDGIQQIKNITAVVVRGYAPNIVPPQTGWIWVDKVNGKSYISVGTSLVSDWSILGVLGGGIGDTNIAIGNTSGNLTSYPTLGFVNATGVLYTPNIQISSLTAGRIPFVGPTNILTDDNSLFWDNTNKRLGIGKSTPSQKFHLESGTLYINNENLGINNGLTGAGLFTENTRLTTVDYAGNQFLIGGYFRIDADCSVSSSTTLYVRGLQGNAWLQDGAGNTEELAGLSFGTYNLQTSSNILQSSKVLSVSYNHRSAGKVIDAYGLRYLLTRTSSGTGIISNHYGIYSDSSALTSYITKDYGLYIKGSDNSLNYIQGSLGINTSAPSEKVHIIGNLFIDTDSNKLLLGAGKDMSVYYDGTYGYIKTSEIAASDLKIVCGTEKTLVLETPVWDDIQFSISNGKVPAANYPDYDTFTTNTKQFKFNINDYIDLEANELLHRWKEGTDGYPHIHTALNGANASGSSQYAKFTVYVAYADEGQVYTEINRDIEIEIPDGTADLTHIFGSATTNIDFSGVTIGTQCVLRIKRIAATTGTEYPNHIFVTQVGFHMQKDTMGSRQIGTK